MARDGVRYANYLSALTLLDEIMAKVTKFPAKILNSIDAQREKKSGVLLLLFVVVIYNTQYNSFFGLLRVLKHYHYFVAAVVVYFGLIEYMILPQSNFFNMKISFVLLRQQLLSGKHVLGD